MKFGLNEETLLAIETVFERFWKIDRAVVFGSRAKGNFKLGSDIDIAVFGFNLDAEDISRVTAQLENLNLPYKIDLLNYKTISEPALKEHIDRVGVEIYRRWKEYRLGDLISLEYGKGLINYQNTEGKYAVFGTNGQIGTSNICLYDKPSIIIGRKGAYRGVHLSIAPFFVIDTAFYTKKRREDLNTIFLYYWLKTLDINEMDSGSAIPSTSRDEVYDAELRIPPSPEQTAIAELLANLDNKIDLLHRQNKTLEQLAETLFMKWVIEGAEKNLNEKCLLDVIELVGGGTPKTDIPEYWNGPIRWLTGGDIANNHKKFIINTEKSITELGLKSSSTSLLPAFSTVISARGTVGKYCLLSEPMAFSQSNYGIKPKYEHCPFFTYLLIAHTVSELLAAAYGSVFDTITTNTFKEQVVRIPDEEAILIFEKSIENHFLKILHNQQQIRTLTQLRDALLPKLMRGEVRIDLTTHEKAVNN